MGSYAMNFNEKYILVAQYENVKSDTMEPIYQ